MKKSMAVFILMAASVVAYGASDADLLTAISLLMQSETEECGTCGNDDVKKSLKILNKNFKPGEMIPAEGGIMFVRNADCDANEFVLSNRQTREKVKFTNGADGVLPLVTYRFHADNDHLAGIDQKNYTAAEILKLLPAAKMKKKWKGEGSAELVAYPYGDGKCFIYFPKSNKLQFQCRIISLKNVKI